MINDAPPPSSAPYRSFRITHYGATKLSEGEVPVPGPDGKPLGSVSPKSWQRLKVEGSGVLPDGRGISVTSSEPLRYKLLPKGVLGRGRGGNLTPFEDVAVDMGNLSGKQPWKDGITRSGPFIAQGTKLYIAEFRGLILPNGRTHTGWVTAKDNGAGIYGKHLDFFTGYVDDKPNGMPEEASVYFSGIAEIPPDDEYDYGLHYVEHYKDLRPPPKSTRTRQPVASAIPSKPTRPAGRFSFRRG